MKWFIPPVLVFVCGVFMVAADHFFPSMVIFPSPFRYAGVVLMVVGFSFPALAGGQLIRYNTEIHTFKKPRRLVTTGLFSISRNPIYLGFAIFLIGFWIWRGTLLPGFGCILFIVAANAWYIPFEERALRQAFGKEYEKYCAKVRRWI